MCSFDQEPLTVQKAESCQIDIIMPIFDKARLYMRKNGNLQQWINGYPDRQTILYDISKGNFYIIVDENNEITGCFSFIIGDDPTYAFIEGGEWPNNHPYGTIHRIASTGNHRGILETAVNFGFSKIADIRIDTHRDNQSMLNALERLGFRHCGTIYCHGGTQPRLAFHKRKECS